MIDWANKLVARKRKRGDKQTTAEELRRWVIDVCEKNLSQWYGKNNEEAKAAKPKEIRRLIKLQIDRDRRDQFKYDYEQKGIFIQPDHAQRKKIGSVKLPFTKEEWADLLNADGDHLAACCADISRIRDILQGACRDGYYIDVEDMFEAVHLAKHHGFLAGEDPIGRMITLWDKIKEDVRSQTIDSSANLDDPKEALQVLYQSAETICWENIYSKEHDIKDRVFNRRLTTNYALATIKTAVRTLFFKLKEMDTGDIEGYGLVRDDGEFGYSRRGLAMFRTQEFAQEICNRWNKEIEKDKRHEEKRYYAVKKLRVSFEKGIEILPDDYEIKITPDVEAATEKEEPISL